MNTRERVRMHTLKFGLIFCIILFGELRSCSAQKFKEFVSETHAGLEGSFGIKYFRLSSNISPLHNLKVTEEGGAIGLAVGARWAKLKIRQGFYYSSSAVAYTINEIRSTASVNFYPLPVLSKNNRRFQPYFLAAIENSILKMYGYYGPEISGRNGVNYSTAEAPYLGRISVIQAAAGAGLAYNIKKPGYFVSMFCEADYGMAMRVRSHEILFSETSMNNALAVNIGIRYGYIH